MIAELIPQPYRNQLLSAAQFSKELPRTAVELAAVAKIIDEIRSAASIPYPGLFKAGPETEIP